jgi:hypothetical protein
VRYRGDGAYPALTSVSPWGRLGQGGRDAVWGKEMGWAIFILVVVVCFAIVFPGFRYFALIVVVIA